MAAVISKVTCPSCRKSGGDKSGNNLVMYSDGGAFCFACNYVIYSDTYNNQETEQEEELVFEMAEFSEEDHTQLKAVTSFNGKGFRGIRDETYKYFGVRHSYDTETGELVAQYYPVTTNYEFEAYKVRRIPKQFSCLGAVGNHNDLFGQFRFQNASGKYCLIAAGEIDMLSAYQLLRDYQASKGHEDYEPIPVVSPTTGETSSHKQLQAQYEWFDRFERIIVCYDNDKAGKEAAEKVVKILPRGKVYLMELALKDTNEYLMAGKNKEWINLFFKARKFVPAGVTSSLDLEDKMKEYVGQQRISLPPFMHRLQKKLRGGFPLGQIVNLLSASGTGKSTFTDAMVLHWIMDTKYTVGIVSLEASEGEYGVNLSSSFCSFKLNLLESAEERLEYLQQPQNIAKRQQLWQNEEGDPRFYLVDGDIDNLKSKVEYLVVSLGCKIIVLDPLQDVFDALDEDQQAKFMKWQKDIAKSQQITFININHSRKSQQGQKANSKGAELNEEDMMGSSTIFKSGGINLVMWRNKEAEDSFERNTTHMKVTKARGVGDTGFAGDYYYDNPTHQLHDLQDWLEKHPQQF